MYLKIFVAAVLALGVLATPIAQTTTLPLDEVRPGMVGVGRTVFHGTELEDFKVHVLGVMRNVIGPKRSLILARLEGGPLAKTGVIAGMSGSPVYVDGRLMGAVSYSLGQFSTEPIAGITPIAEMLDATMTSAPARGTRPVAMTFPATPRELLDIWANDLGRAQPFVTDPSQALIVSGGADLSRVSATLRPIAVPMIASGFDASVIDPLSPSLAAAGFVTTSSSASQSRSSSTSQARVNATEDRPLRPGDAVGVGQLTGGVERSGPGRVTHVQR